MAWKDMKLFNHQLIEIDWSNYAMAYYNQGIY